MKKNISILNSKFYLIAFLALASFIIGVIHGYYIDASLKHQVISHLTDYISTVVGDVQGIQLFWTIFWNNFQVSMILFISGFVILLPLMILYTNGLGFGVLSFAIDRMFNAFNLPNNNFVFHGTIIHGIPELLAIFLASAFGMYIGFSFIGLAYRFITYLLYGHKHFPNQFDRDYDKAKYSFYEVFKRVLYYFIILVIPLLLVASFLETYVTPAYLESTMTKSIDSTESFYDIFESLDFINNCTKNDNLSMFNLDTQTTLTEIVLDPFYNDLTNLLSKENLANANFTTNNDSYLIMLPNNNMLPVNYNLMFNNTNLTRSYNGNECVVIFSDIFDCEKKVNITTIFCE